MRDLIDRVIKNKKRLLGIPGGRFGASGRKERRMEKSNEVFKIAARRCRRCGGILTSAQGMRDGYGPCCLRKAREEEAQRREEEKLVSLFDLAAEGREARPL